MKKYSLSQRVIKAENLHKMGYNCSQCVIMSFNDITNLDDDTASKITSALGSGVAGQRQICGTLTAAAIIKGLTSFNTPKDKPVIARETSVWINSFKEKHGSIVCGELLTKPDRKPCMKYIEDVITIIDNSLN